MSVYEYMGGFRGGLVVVGGGGFSRPHPPPQQHTYISRPFDSREIMDKCGEFGTFS